MPNAETSSTRATAACRSHGVVIARLCGLALTMSSLAALAQPVDNKPYDDKLTRLAEILGAVHYLRELCGNSDGQLWRDRMRDLVDSEGNTGIRRAMLSKSFNDGYRSYSRTYQSCTPTAQVAIDRFLVEGAGIADGLAASVP